MTTPKELVESNFPSYFIEQYPQFTKFIEEYYNFLESSIAILSDNKDLAEGDIIYGSLSKAKAVVKTISKDRIYFDYITKTNEFFKNEVIFNGDTGEVYFIRSLYKNIYQYIQDIEKNTAYETTLNIFKKYFKKNVSLDHSIFRRLDPKTLTKRILDYYKNKSTENSYYWFFRIFFDDNIELYYPKVDILKLSDSGYYEKNLIQIDYKDGQGTFSDARIYAPGSKASAICRNAITNIKDNNKRFFLDLVYINGTFVKNEEIIAYDMATGLEIGRTHVIESIIGVKITDGGIGHKVGDRFIFNDGVGEISKLKKHSVTNIEIVNPGIAYRVGDPIVFDNAFTGSTYTANAYVAEINPNPTLTKYFNDYYNIIKNKQVGLYDDKSLLNEVFTGSELFKDINPLFIIPPSVSDEYQVGSIKSIRFDDSGLEYKIPPRISAINQLGQASLLSTFDLILNPNDANTQYITANTKVILHGGTVIPNDENIAVCVDEIEIDNDKHGVYLEDFPLLSEDFTIKRFVTSRSLSNLEDDTHVSFMYSNTAFSSVNLDFSDMSENFSDSYRLLTADIVDLLEVKNLSNTAELNAILGDGIAEVKLNQLGLMARETDPIRFIRNPEEFTYNDPLIAHGLLSELEFETDLMFKPFGDFLDNNSMLSSNKYFFDNYYYQHYSYEIITKIPAALIEPLLLDELHPAGFLAFVRNKFEAELDLRIKTVELPEIEIESMGYLTSEVYPFVKVQIQSLGESTVSQILQKEIESEFLHNEEITTKEEHEIEVDGIADIFETFKYFMDDIISKPVDKSFFEFEDYNKTKEFTNITNLATYYDGIVAVESFVKIINVEDEANWVGDVIKYKMGPIKSMREKTIRNFRITTEIIQHHVADINKGGMIVVRDFNMDLDAYYLSSDKEYFDNTNLNFDESYDISYKPIISGNSLGGSGSYLPESQILTLEYGWVKFKDLQPGTHVANVQDNGIVKWVIPNQIVRSDYNGVIYRYTDDKSISITVVPDQELVTSDSNNNLTKIKSKNLNISRNPENFYIVSYSKAYTNEIVFEELVRIKNNIKRYEVEYEGPLYCVMIDQFDNNLKMPIVIDKPILDLVQMNSYIDNEYTFPKIKIIDSIVNDDFLEGIKLDFSSMQTIQPSSNTIIFDFNRNRNLINPYPEVAPSELFFFITSSLKANNGLLDQEPSIVVNRTRIEPLSLEHLIFAAPEIDVELKQGKDLFVDYGNTNFKFLSTEVPAKVNVQNINAANVKYSITTTLSDFGVANTVAKVIYDIPLHTVTNIDSQNLPVTILYNNNITDTALSSFITGGELINNFRIDRYTHLTKNRVSNLVLENTAIPIPGHKPKTHFDSQYINFADEKSIAVIGEISNVLCPDHQFKPKGVVTVLNKFFDRLKNKYSATSSLVHVNAFAEREELSVLLEIPAILIHEKIDTFILDSTLEEHEIQNEYFIPAPFQVMSTQENNLIPSEHIDRTAFNRLLDYELDTGKIGYKADTIIPIPLHIDLTDLDPNQKKRYIDPLSTLGLGGNEPVYANATYLDTELKHLYIAKVLNRLDFFDVGDIIKPWEDVAIEDYTNVRHKDWLGDTIPTVTALGETVLYTEVIYKQLPIVYHIDYVTLGHNITLDGTSNLGEVKNHVIETFDVLARKDYIELGDIIHPWVDILIKDYYKARTTEYNGDTMPSMILKSYLDKEIYSDVDLSQNQVITSDATLYFTTPSYLNTESTLEDYETNIIMEKEILDRNLFFDLSKKIYVKILDADIENKYFKQILKYYVDDTLPSVSVDGGTKIILTRSSDGTTPLSYEPFTVLFENKPPHIEANTAVEFEINVVKDTSIIDRNLIFNLYDKKVYGKLLSKQIDEDDVVQILRSTKEGTVQNMTIEYTDIRLERSSATDTFSYVTTDDIVYFDTPTFLDSTINLHETVELEYEIDILDRNNIFPLDRTIATLYYYDIIDKDRPKILRETSENTLPSVSVKSLPTLISDAIANTMFFVDSSTTVIFPNTTFLDATTSLQRVPEQIQLEFDYNLLDKNTIFGLDEKFVFSKYGNKVMSFDILDNILIPYSKDYVRTVSVYNEPSVINKTYLDSTTGVDNLTTITFANTTFLDATSALHEKPDQLKLKFEFEFLDKNKVIGLDEKVVWSLYRNKIVSDEFLSKEIVPYSKDYIKIVSAHNEPHFINKTHLDSTTGVDNLTTVSFANTTFLDATSSVERMPEQIQFELEFEILDRNKVIDLDQKILKSKLLIDVDDLVDKSIIPYSKDYIPSVSVYNEPNFVHKTHLDSTTGVDNLTTIIFANTTFLDATSSIQDSAEEIDFEFEQNILSDYKRISKDTLFKKIYDDRIAEFLNYRIADTFKDSNKVANALNQSEFEAKTHLDSTSGVDNITIKSFNETSFLDSTIGLTDDERVFSSCIVSYTTDYAVYVHDEITEEFQNKKIEDILSQVIVDDVINIRPALNTENYYTINSVYESEQVLVPQEKIEKISNSISNEYAGVSPEFIYNNQSVQKIINNIKDRNICFDLDNKINDYETDLVQEWKPFKLCDNIGETIPTITADSLYKNIFENNYKIRDVADSFIVIDSSLINDATVLYVNNTFRFANTIGIEDNLGFEISSINNGITLEDFLLNNYIQNYENDIIKYHTVKHVKKRNDYKKYNHSSLKMNYVKNEAYSWNISELNTFETNYNDPNINRASYMDSIRIEI